jgi:membrane associated rhomboid family serine protease
MFTYAALAAYVAFFAAQYKHSDLTPFFAFPWRVADGELWRLVTCTFLHGGVLHIAFNLVMFLRFMPVIDNWLGPWGALLLYAITATGSSAAQLLVSNTGLVGASGVVYGLFGFLWVLSRRRDDAAEAANPHTAQTMFAWLGICFVINMFGGNIANTAHIVGLFLGWLIGQCFVARRKARWPLIGATLVAWLLPIAFTYRPVWERTLAHVPYFGVHYPHDTTAEVRAFYEDPERAPDVGLISTRRDR